MDKFADKIGGALRARADLCLLIAEYVPITFEPMAITVFTQIERENGLKRVLYGKHTTLRTQTTAGMGNAQHT